MATPPKPAAPQPAAVPDFEADTTETVSPLDVASLYGIPATAMQLDVPVYGPPSPQGGPPKRTVGDQLDAFYHLTDSQLIQLQRDLYEAGFYPESYYGPKSTGPQYGVFGDADSYEAYKQALLLASKARRTVSDLIGERIGQYRMQGGVRAVIAQAAGVRTKPQLTSSTDLASIADNVAQQTIGRSLTQEEKARFIGSFHGLETGAAGGGGEAAPNVSTAAEQFALTADPKGAAQEHLGKTLDMFQKILGGPGFVGGAPK